jgi:hypothetical protein
MIIDHQEQEMFYVYILKLLPEGNNKLATQQQFQIFKSPKFADRIHWWLAMMTGARDQLIKGRIIAVETYGLF